MSRPYLLDASALLAAIFNEAGADQVFDVIDASEIHAVNLAEAMRKMVSLGTPAGEVVAQIEDLKLEVIEEIGVEQAYDIARLTPEARRLGLSIGDCVCLTTAERRNATAVTADRCWPEIQGRSLKIALIR